LREYSEADFPLSRLDRKGSALKAGHLVRVCEVPDVGCRAFDALDSQRYANLLGRILPISEFDKVGNAVIQMFYTSDDDVTGQSDEPEEPEEPDERDCSTGCHIYFFCFDARDLELV
jgi:hypothetical protein